MNENNNQGNSGGPQGLGEGNSGRAIPLTLIVDYSLTMILSFIVAVFVLGYYKGLGQTQEEVIALLESASIFAPINIPFMIVGLSVSFYAGFKCALWSINNVWRDICIVMVLSQIIETYLLFDELVLWEYVVVTLLDAAVMVAGVNYWIKKNKKYWQR